MREDEHRAGSITAHLLATAGDPDALRQTAKTVVQMLMEANGEGKIGAGRHERSGARITYRNGYRDRGLEIRSPTQARLPHATLKYPRPYP